MVQSFHWQKLEGKVQTESTPISSIEFLKASSTKVHISRPVDISYCLSLDFYLWLTNDGDAFLARRDDQTWKGHVVHKCSQSGQQAILAAFNDSLSVLAIALSNGEVITYKINNDLDKQAVVLCTYKCEDIVGSIRSISFAEDQLTLLLCGEYGWTLRTSVGCKLYSNTVKELADDASTNGSTSNTSRRLRSATWIQGTYGALFLPIDAEAIYVRSFCTVVHRGLHYPQSIVLREPCGMQALSEVITNPLHTRYTRYALPVELNKIIQNYRYVAWSSCGRFIAVCGKHGLAHLSVASGIWKTYKDYADNLQVDLIVEPVWYHHFLIVAISLGENKYEIRLLSREFDVETILDTIVSDVRPVSICASNGQVFIAFENYTIVRSQILRSNERRVTLQAVQQYTLQRKYLPTSASLLSMEVIHETPTNENYRAHLLCLFGTSLYYVNLSLPEEGKLKPYAVVDCVQWFKVIDGLSKLKNALFVYDGSSLRLWFNLSTHGGFVQAYPGADVIIELDFIPLTVSGEQGLIDGFVLDDKAVNLSDSTGISGLRYQTRSFVPDVLEVLLTAGLVGDAFAISTRFSSQPQFPYVLEVLLYKALESSSEGHTDLLTTTWKLLQKHAQLMPEVVVACARKSEISTWDVLFSVTGAPLQFYQESLSNNDLKTAAAYLMILLTLNTDLKHEEVNISAQL
ncbi:protein of unknown function [Taphrina deformans PYCC 5710]|uniref:RIC1 C-terminal alpha solenoid region domain-containing protein n=1 Tax=Taphrina deformans (strain PYCC 5710 / ATCC 11124 / CBS 356.35 / IMI 108563 / JCM 9778 / NBRC 8474) TaxID=1097556 RepID=R4XJW5_TAPDE|nr:protein of unknown function [Taphrina deformans PYCC 5710]|eukprot:CCG84738.1 protein of unknown function [Taphrina deformans PYCC 5710]